MNDKDFKLLFFTCATGFYENFIPNYVFFTAFHNKNCAFEFLVSDKESFLKKHSDVLFFLEKKFDTVIVIRDVPILLNKPKMDNSLRFLVEPVTKAEYVYIADIDIIILEDIFVWHEPVFLSGLPYSNIVRPNTKRLTGLHFARYDCYYPLPCVDDIIKSTSNDEALLFKIVERKVGIYPSQHYLSSLDLAKPFRPLHGIHMSLNRLPYSFHKERVSWCLDFKDIVKLSIFMNLNTHQGILFNEFYNLLYPGSSQILLNLIFLTKGVICYGEEFYSNNVSF